MFLRSGKDQRPLWLPDVHAPRKQLVEGTREPEDLDEPDPLSIGEASRILDEVWSTMELSWNEEEEEVKPPNPGPETLPDPDLQKE